MKLKITLGILLGLGVLLVAAVVVIGLRLDTLVKAGLETVAPKVTQTTLTVDAVHISLLGGSASVKGLVLGNPEGYQAPQSISISNAAVSLVSKSVLSQKIVIRSIELQAPEITFEGNPFGANNLTKIMANVNAMTGPANQAGAKAPASGGKPARRFEVDELAIIGAQVHASLPGLDHAITLPIADIHLTDLGQGTNGITAADLTQQVLAQITTGTIKTLASHASDLGKDVTGAAKNAVQGVLGNSTNGAGGIEGLKKGLGGLLGK
jgi:uncharacterized protein involved in outer membrane biogenesis